MSVPACIPEQVVYDQRSTCLALSMVVRAQPLCGADAPGSEYLRQRAREGGRWSPSAHCRLSSAAAEILEKRTGEAGVSGAAVHRPSCIHLSICLSIHHPSIHPSTHTSVCPSVYLTIHLSTYSPIHPSDIYPSALAGEAGVTAVETGLPSALLAKLTVWSED